MKKQSGLGGKLLILTTALLWSTAGVLVKYIPWSSYAISSVRGLIAMLALLGLRKMGGKTGRVRFTRHNVAAGAATFLTSTLFLTANKLTTAANAIVLQYIAPILILLYTVVVEKRRPSAAEVLLTGTVFLGCVLAFSDKLGGSASLGDGLALLSGVTFAALILISRSEKTQAEDGQIIGCGLSFLCCLPFWLLDGTFSLNPQSAAAMLFLGLVQYSLANFLFAKGVKRTEPTATAIILTVEPIMNPVWVFFVLGERPGARALAGFVLVIAAVTLYSLLPLMKQRGDVKA